MSLRGIDKADKISVNPNNVKEEASKKPQLFKKKKQEDKQDQRVWKEEQPKLP